MKSDTYHIVTDETTGGMKGTQLARPSLIPVKPLWALSEHYGRNLEKYPERNWEKGYKWHLSYDAILRHSMKWWNGEDNDPDGFNHMVAVAWHALTLLEFTDTHPELDNRPKKS